ncbi:MAG: bifunctional riboflavin kinase/FMN adenylyltransferase [Lentimicrobiaceae bacterium]|jgi:riboflavin kinase/FMN adenylyltransferase|nr:bifunctional riboflavin kinase/FMN adenylyltransferase [Lentimicrobiaceae bacterium]
MKIFHNLEDIRNIKKPVVTTGSFDGVHVGHKTIIRRINTLARQIGGESVLVTFHPHPRKVLYPDTAGKNLLLINSQEEKIELLRKTGLDNLVIINFTIEFSRLSSIDFIRNILVGKLHASIVVIGFNHHFGHNAEGDFNYLYELGKYYNFKVEEIPEQDIHNETVSSTLIRNALLEGKIERATAYLDHHYMIIGKMFKMEESLVFADFPTINILIEEECKLIPPDGVYAVSAQLKDAVYKGLVNIKNFSQKNERSLKDISVELHAFGTDTYPTDENVTLLFAKRIRDERTFSGLEELKKQLASDKAIVEDLIY